MIITTVVVLIETLINDVFWIYILISTIILVETYRILVAKYIALVSQ